MSRKRAVIDLQQYPGLYVTETYRGIGVRNSDDLIRSLARRVRGLLRLTGLEHQEAANRLYIEPSKLKAVLDVRDPQPFCTGFMVKLHELISDRDTYSLLDTRVGDAKSLGMSTTQFSSASPDMLQRLLNLVAVVSDQPLLNHLAEVAFKPRVDWRDYLDSGRAIDMASQVIAERIKAVRRSMGISRARLAELVQVSKSTIQKIEEYERQCPFYLLTIIGHALGMPREAFWSAQPFNSHLVYGMKMYQEADERQRSTMRLIIHAAAAELRNEDYRIMMKVENKEVGRFETRLAEDFQSR